MTKEVELQLGYIMRIFERNNITLSLTENDLVKGAMECCYFQGKLDVGKKDILIINKPNKIKTWLIFMFTERGKISWSYVSLGLFLLISILFDIWALIIILKINN